MKRSYTLGEVLDITKEAYAGKIFRDVVTNA